MTNLLVRQHNETLVLYCHRLYTLRKHTLIAFCVCVVSVPSAAFVSAVDQITRELRRVGSRSLCNHARRCHVKTRDCLVFHFVLKKADKYTTM